MNKIPLHDTCTDARTSCTECAKMIANVLGIPLGVFLMLRSYILRLEQGDKYVHPVD